MEVAAGVHRIETPMGERINCLYLLRGDMATMLVDTGLAGTPEADLDPVLAELGLGWADLDYVVNTHSDMDHMGGNAAIRALAPAATLVCHELDRAQIEDLELMIDQRYGEYRHNHGHDDGDGVRDWIRANATSTPLDLGVRGGEQVRLGADWVVELVHTPGHSWGSLSVWEPRSRAAIVGDAVLGDAVPLKDGSPAFPPTYRYVDTYEASIGILEARRPGLLLTSHYAIARGPEVADFLGLTRAFAAKVEQTLRDALAASPAPQTLLELCTALSGTLGRWPATSAAFLTYPLLGHLERLVGHGLVIVGRREGLATYAWAA
jgi:glyoxylase-like metal-dependent hydrolase (beta-lactamase superfamily II)